MSTVCGNLKGFFNFKSTHGILDIVGKLRKNWFGSAGHFSFCLVTHKSEQILVLLAIYKFYSRAVIAVLQLTSTPTEVPVLVPVKRDISDIHTLSYIYSLF